MSPVLVLLGVLVIGGYVLERIAAWAHYRKLDIRVKAVEDAARTANLLPPEFR